MPRRNRNAHATRLDLDALTDRLTGLVYALGLPQPAVHGPGCPCPACPRNHLQEEVTTDALQHWPELARQ